MGGKDDNKAVFRFAWILKIEGPSSFVIRAMLILFAFVLILLLLLLSVNPDLIDLLLQRFPHVEGVDQ